MFSVARRTRRRFQPTLDGLPLRIAPTVFTPPAPPPEIFEPVPPTSNDEPPPPPPPTVLEPLPPCSAD